MQKIDTISHRECCKANRRWCLEGYFLTSGQPIRVMLMDLPLKIGRGNVTAVSINQPSISRLHAEVNNIDGCMAIRDCGSRNGTFVNHQRIMSPTVLHPGDFVHLGSCEFRVVLENETLDEHRGPDETWHVKEPGRRALQSLMTDQAVYAKFQPVVHLDSQSVFAFESLGRGNHPEAPTRPDELFRMAKHFGYSQALSHMFRVHALKSAEKMSNNYQLFINIHPDELQEPDTFIEEMGQIRDLYPQMNLVVEVPESLIIETDAVTEIQKGLKQLGYGLAYDDFGTGQSRLIQLADCPPDYLKFDRSLIANLESASRQRQKLVEMLVRFANEIGVVTVAEGVETLGESEVCRQMGFKCGQGYLFGRPMSLEQAMAI